MADLSNTEIRCVPVPQSGAQRLTRAANTPPRRSGHEFQDTRCEQATTHGQREARTFVRLIWRHPGRIIRDVVDWTEATPARRLVGDIIGAVCVMILSMGLPFILWGLQ